jgi:hypothetical protein
MAAIERTPQRTRPLSSTLFYGHLHATAHFGEKKRLPGHSAEAKHDKVIHTAFSCEAAIQ